MTNERAILRLEMLYENCEEEMCEGACIYCLDAIKKATESLEREPKRGKWIDIEGQLGMQCSECGKMCNEITLCTDMMTKAHWNYCPNCGAEMEE